MNITRIAITRLFSALNGQPLPNDPDQLWLLLQAATITSKTHPSQAGARAEWSPAARALRTPLVAHLVDMRRHQWALIERWNQLSLHHAGKDGCTWVSDYVQELEQIQARMDLVLRGAGHFHPHGSPPSWLRPLKLIAEQELLAGRSAGAYHWAQWQDTGLRTQTQAAFAAMYSHELRIMGRLPNNSRQRYAYADDRQMMARQEKALTELKRALTVCRDSTPTTGNTTLNTELLELARAQHALLTSARMVRVLDTAALKLAVMQDAPANPLAALPLETRNELSYPLGRLADAYLELHHRVREQEEPLTAGMSLNQRELWMRWLLDAHHNLPALFTQDDSITE